MISNDFDDSPDLTEDANMLLQLLQVGSREKVKLGRGLLRPEGSDTMSDNAKYFHIILTFMIAITFP